MGKHYLSDHTATKSNPGRLTRRAVLRSAVVASAGTAGGFAAGRLTSTGAVDTSATPKSVVPAAVPALGAHQAGVARPADPQPYALVSVADVGEQENIQVGLMLAALGQAIAEVTTPGLAPASVAPDGIGDLTVCVGIGPRLVRLAGALGGAAAGTALPASQPLPDFSGDVTIDSSARDGDMMIAIHASDATLAYRVRDYLAAAVPGWLLRWAQLGFRNTMSAGRSRDPLGFIDGITVPRTAEELAASVWIPDGPARDGTVCVVRRIALDVAGFHDQSLAEQERMIGRRMSTGAPLSGGGPLDPIDLTAPGPDRAYAIPARAHVRAAHQNGVPMLRRAYNYADDSGDSGVLFMSFQRDVDTFITTQRRLDANDALMRYARASASGAFLVLPGFDVGSPLGSTLFQLPVPGMRSGRTTLG